MLCRELNQLSASSSVRVLWLLFHQKDRSIFRFLCCSSREMRHKILKNAAVEINCETMHTLKSVSLLINLQERIPNELKAHWQGGGSGGRGCTSHPRDPLPNGDFTLIPDVNELLLWERRGRASGNRGWARLESEKHLCGLPPYRTGSKTLAVPIQKNTFDNPVEPSAHTTLHYRYLSCLLFAASSSRR